MKELAQSTSVTIHELKMLQIAEPEGLLTLQIFKQDGLYRFCVDDQIDALLKGCHKGSQLTKEQLVLILKAVSVSIHSCYKHLLDYNRLRLSFDGIYEAEQKKYSILYLPFDDSKQGFVNEKLQSLLSLLSDNMIGEDQGSLELLSQLQRYCVSESFEVLMFSMMISEALGCLK